MADRSPNLSGGKSYSDGRRHGNRSDQVSPVATPTKFRTPRSPSSLPRPTVYERQCSRWHSDLQMEKVRLQIDLNKMVKDWEAEINRLEKALGDKGLETLLEHLAKINPKQERELRAYADELTGVLATAKVLRELHRQVKVVQDWNALSRDVLDALKSRQTSVNVLTLRKQAVSYFVWSAISLARVAAFSCFLAGVAGSAIPSLVFAGASILPAGLQTGMMVRNHFQLQEKYYRSQAAAFESMGCALRGLENFPAHTVDDALAMLAFRDACSSLPQFSPAAALDAQQAGYARIRDQGVMPVNILTSCLGQILSMIHAPLWSSSLSLGLSSVGYSGQAILNGLQGRVEYDKATRLGERYSAWLKSKADCGQMQQWANRNVMNRAAQIGMTAHYSRKRTQQEPEVTGSLARLVKSPFDAVNALMAGAASALPWFDLAPPGFTVMAGLVASSISAVERTVAGVRLWKRGNVGLDAKARQLQARLMLALLDPRELLDLINKQSGGSLMLSVPTGNYDERTGFAMSSPQVLPAENEFIALEALADAVDVFADGESGDDDPLPELLIQVLGMNSLDWINLLRVLKGMRNGEDRIAFIKQRLAAVLKIDFNLEPNGMEPALPAEVVMHRFLLALADDELDLEQLFADTQGSDPETQWGLALEDKLATLLSDFGEDAFLAALEEVWTKRRPCSDTSKPRLSLFALHVLGKHLIDKRTKFANQLRSALAADKHALIMRHRYPETDVNAFVDAIEQLLRAAPAQRAQRREALYHLARMKLTQELLLKSQRFRSLACHADLMKILGLVDRVVEPDGDPENELVYSVDGSTEDTFPDSDLISTVSSSDPLSDSDRADQASESLRSPDKQNGVADGAQSPEAPASPGVTLLALIRKPLAARRSARTHAVLQAVVTQLPTATPPVRASNSSRLAFALPIQTPYTPVQPPETPLATPRGKAVGTPSGTPQLESLRHRAEAEEV